MRKVWTLAPSVRVNSTHIAPLTAHLTRKVQLLPLLDGASSANGTGLPVSAGLWREGSATASLTPLIVPAPGSRFTVTGRLSSRPERSSNSQSLKPAAEGAANLRCAVDVVVGEPVHLRRGRRLLVVAFSVEVCVRVGRQRVKPGVDAVPADERRSRRAGLDLAAARVGADDLVVEPLAGHPVEERVDEGERHLMAARQLVRGGSRRGTQRSRPLQVPDHLVALSLAGGKPS